MVAGAHLCVAHPVLVSFSGISAGSVGMSGVELFMLPEVGPAKCLCFICTVFLFLSPLCIGEFGF